MVFAERYGGPDRDGMVARMTPSLLPLGRARDGDSIPPWGSLVNQEMPLQVIRYIVVLVTGFIAGSRTVEAAHSWQEWHSWAPRDPSSAEAYRSFFLVNLAVALLSLSIAGLVWWLLRPAAKRRGY